MELSFIVRHHDQHEQCQHEQVIRTIPISFCYLHGLYINLNQYKRHRTAVFEEERINDKYFE